MKKQNELTTFKEEALTLSTMLVKAVETYEATMPIIDKIHKKILDIFAEEESLNVMSQKDLMSLLKLMSDAQLKPIGELTKMAVAIKDLQEATELADRIKAVEQIVETYKVEKEQADAYKAPEITIVDAE